MHTLNAIYAQQMVEAIRLDMERDRAGREIHASLPKSSFVASSRRIIGSVVIGTGKFIQGRPKAEMGVDPSLSSKSALELIP
jgi:hypothetical protein